MTVPWEDGCKEAYERKACHAVPGPCQAVQGHRNGSAWLFPVEVGCRGFPAQSVWRTLTALEVSVRERKIATHRLGGGSGNSIFCLSNRREELSWRPGEDGQ